MWHAEKELHLFSLNGYNLEEFLLGLETQRWMLRQFSLRRKWPRAATWFSGSLFIQNLTEKVTCTEEKTQMANKSMKIHSISLVIREMEIQTMLMENENVNENETGWG